MKSQTKEGFRLLPSARLLMAILAFTACMVQYMQRMMTSVAVVCMVNHTWIKHDNAKYTTAVVLTNLTHSVSEKCYFNGKHSLTDGTLKWNKATQGLVLGSFFWGYILTQILGGVLSKKYGPRIVVFISFMIASLSSLLLPLSARYSVFLFIVMRVVNGAMLGILWPSIATMWYHWAPHSNFFLHIIQITIFSYLKDERSLLIGIGNSGSQIGNAITLPLGSFLCVQGFDEGWGSIFYIFGTIGIVWSITWLLLSSDTPNTHSLISIAEINYISEQTQVTKNSKPESLKDAPWKEIMTSVPCLSFYATLTCNNWGAYTFLTNIPTYMKEVLKFDIKSNGTLSAIPYILFWIFIVVSGRIADQLQESYDLSRTSIRRLFCAISNFIPMLAVIGLIFIDCTNPYSGLALLCIGLASTGTGYSAGFLINSNDIGGKYAGIVFGVANTYGTIPGILAPYVTGLVTRNSLQSEWRIVFIIAATIYFIGGIQAVFFISGELQPWAVKHVDEPLCETATEKDDFSYEDEKEKLEYIDID